MRGPSDDDSPDTVGYGRPPKSSQFRTGQSGNPRGRPRKIDKLQVTHTIFPTRKALRNEAMRPIPIKDASGSYEVTATEAVLRAQFMKAVQGSVLAQRDYLARQLAEDERHHQEKKEIFDFWQALQERGRAQIAAARRERRAEAEPLPHPEDIKLDWERLEVRLTGPVNQEGLTATKLVLEMRRLCLAMSQYFSEKSSRPTAPGDQGKIGSYFALFLLATKCLPPRLRDMSEADMLSATEISDQKASGGDGLRRRCEAIGLPFFRWKPGFEMPQLSVAEMGLHWPGGLEFVRSPSKGRRPAPVPRRPAKEPAE